MSNRSDLWLWEAKKHIKKKYNCNYPVFTNGCWISGLELADTRAVCDDWIAYFKSYIPDLLVEVNLREMDSSALLNDLTWEWTNFILNADRWVLLKNLGNGFFKLKDFSLIANARVCDELAKTYIKELDNKTLSLYGHTEYYFLRGRSILYSKKEFLSEIILACRLGFSDFSWLNEPVEDPSGRGRVIYEFQVGYGQLDCSIANGYMPLELDDYY